MKRILTLICIINLVGLIGKAYSLPWPPDVWIIEISFNYSSGSTTYDAVTLKANASTYKPVPEWKAGVRNHKVAYIQNQSNRKIETKFQLDRSGDYIMGVYAEEFQPNYGIGDVNETEVHFDGSDESTPEVMTCDGSVPSGVRKNYRFFHWKWYVTYVCEDWVEPEYFEEPLYIGYSGVHCYYTLFDEPQSPMSEPWIEVLDYACYWADGETEESGALEALTTDLYTNSGLVYDGSDSYYDCDRWPNPTKFTFYLTDLLNDWNLADCQDCAMFLSILSSSIGASLTQTRRLQGGFITKDLLAIGGDPSEDWDTQTWAFHQVAWIDNVYDSCVKLKEASPYIPINVNIDNPYKVDLLEPEQTWSVRSPFRLGQTDPYYNVPTEIQ